MKLLPCATQVQPCATCYGCVQKRAHVLFGLFCRIRYAPCLCGSFKAPQIIHERCKRGGIYLDHFGSKYSSVKTLTLHTHRRILISEAKRTNASRVTQRLPARNPKGDTGKF